MLTFEQQPTQGSAAIVEKLQVIRTFPDFRDRANTGKNLPFQQIQHQTATIDAQPSADDGILVLVTGALMVSMLVRK